MGRGKGRTEFLWGGGGPGGKRVLGRPKHKWENSIEADLY